MNDEPGPVNHCVSATARSNPVGAPAVTSRASAATRGSTPSVARNAGSTPAAPPSAARSDSAVGAGSRASWLHACSCRGRVLYAVPLSGS